MFKFYIYANLTTSMISFPNCTASSVRALLRRYNYSSRNICTPVTKPSTKQHSVRATQLSHKRCTGKKKKKNSSTAERVTHARTCQSRAAHLGCGREHVECVAASTTNPCLSAVHHTATLKGWRGPAGGKPGHHYRKHKHYSCSTAAASLAHHPPLPACPHIQRRYGQAAPERRVNSRKPKWAEKCRRVPRGRTHEEQGLLGLESSVTI